MATMPVTQTTTVATAALSAAPALVSDPLLPSAWARSYFSAAAAARVDVPRMDDVPHVTRLVVNLLLSQLGARRRASAPPTL